MIAVEPDTQPIGVAMVIDDEAFDQKMYRRILERSGLVGEVMGFAAADRALDYLQANPDHPVDVVFLDINMPRMNGFEFLEAAVATLGPKFAAICVVMLTTSLDPKDHERARQFDVVKEFLKKPLTAEDVVHVAGLLKDL